MTHKNSVFTAQCC